MLSIFTDHRTLALFILTFTLIVAVHEFGHFATARLLGMKVLEFAFGFPPRAAGFKRGETEYTVNWIPFGGFVRILGQDDFSIKQQGEGDPRAFTSKPWWAQALVLVAGVVMNFVLALVVLTAAFATGTTAPTGDVKIVEVSPGSPAQAAGLQAGDIVKQVDSTPIHAAKTLVNYTGKAAEKGQEITLQLERNGRPIAPVTALPRLEPPPGQGPLGIKLEEAQAPVAVGLPQAFGQAAALTGEVVTQIVELPGRQRCSRRDDDLLTCLQAADDLGRVVADEAGLTLLGYIAFLGSGAYVAAILSTSIYSSVHYSPILPLFARTAHRRSIPCGSCGIRQTRSSS